MTTTVASTRWLDDPVESGPAAGFGIYLHVPFCAHRCGYCDFATSDEHGHLVGRYVGALRDEVVRWSEAGDWPAVTSVFVGGGTPTLLPGEDLAGIVALVRERFAVAPDAEVTVEANPETVDRAKLGALVGAGVTRLSVGAQSFAPSVLATLERRHRPEKVGEAVVAAREAGVGEVSADLIYGTPGETAEDWEDSLRAILDLGVDHVSAYALTLPPRHRIGAPDPDVQRERFEVARAVLDGWDHYELSNWARTPGRRSRHNVLYWRHGDYLGLGVGAHGHLSGHRWWNERAIERWFDAPLAGSEDLSVDERAEERLLLGLRLREGLHPAEVPPLRPEAVQDAADAGLLQLSCGRFQATDDGWFLLDELLRRLA